MNVLYQIKTPTEPHWQNGDTRWYPTRVRKWTLNPKNAPSLFKAEVLLKAEKVAHFRWHRDCVEAVLDVCTCQKQRLLGTQRQITESLQRPQLSMWRRPEKSISLPAIQHQPLSFNSNPIDHLVFLRSGKSTDPTPAISGIAKNTSLMQTFEKLVIGPSIFQHGITTWHSQSQAPCPSRAHAMRPPSRHQPPFHPEATVMPSPWAQECQRQVPQDCMWNWPPEAHSRLLGRLQPVGGAHILHNRQNMRQRVLLTQRELHPVLNSWSWKILPTGKKQIQRVDGLVDGDIHSRSTFHPPANCAAKAPLQNTALW